MTICLIGDFGFVNGRTARDDAIATYVRRMDRVH